MKCPQIYWVTDPTESSLGWIEKILDADGSIVTAFDQEKQLIDLEPVREIIKDNPVVFNYFSDGVQRNDLIVDDIIVVENGVKALNGYWVGDKNHEQK